MKKIIFVLLVTLLSFSVYSYECDDLKSYGLACKTNDYGLLDCENKYNKFHKFLPAIPAGVIVTEELLPPIIGAITGATTLGLTSSSKKPCDPCDPPAGIKFNIKYDPPGSHSHYPCTIKQGHWHYLVNNQEPPPSCECHPKREFGGCGKPPNY